MKTDKLDGLSVTECRVITRRFPLGDTAAPFCGDRKGSDRCPGVEFQWNCTRYADHSGPHVAHSPDGLAAALWHESEVVN